MEFGSMEGLEDEEDDEVEAVEGGVGSLNHARSVLRLVVLPVRTVTAFRLGQYSKIFFLPGLIELGTEADFSC
jgi:hypothetical protein